MQRRGCSYLGHGRAAARRARDLAATHGLGRLLDLERLDQLIQESRYSVREFRVGHLRRQPLGNFDTAPLDEVSSIDRQEFVQHFRELELISAPGLYGFERALEHGGFGLVAGVDEAGRVPREQHHAVDARIEQLRRCQQARVVVELVEGGRW